MTVKLKWYTPQGDSMIAHMARVSNSKAKPEDPAERLIAYLLRNRHWSPFEMVSACVEIDTERDISAQLLRHRSFSFQEFSTRYSEVAELRGHTELRMQDDKNRQNSLDPETVGDMFNGYPVVETGVVFYDAVRDVREKTEELYKDLIARGVAKEVARRILPIGLVPTKLYMAGTVRSWLHYLSVRLEPGTQKEHRDIAINIREVLKPCFPGTFAAAEQFGLLPE